MEDELIERLHDDLTNRVKKLAAACTSPRDLVDMEKELKTCVDKLRSLRPIQDQLRDIQKKIEVLRNQEISRKTGAADSGATSGGSGRFRPVGASGGGMGGADVLETQVVQERATVTIARDMLRTVYETSDMGSAALTELDRQGKQIDRAHDNVRRVHESLDTAEEHITGMKSIFGGLINKFRGKTKAVKLDTDVDFPVEWERGKKFESKNMRFGVDEFCRIGSSGVNRGSIKYKEVNGILVTGEGVFEIGHGKDGRECIRSGQYKQIIALLLRKCNRPINVLFSGAPEFDPRTIPVPGYSLGSGFGRRAEAALLTATAGPAAETEDVDALEAQLLDSVSLGLGDIKAQALTMNQELGRQQRKLEAFEIDVDSAVSRIRRDNHEIKKLM